MTVHHRQNMMNIRAEDVFWTFLLQIKTFIADFATDCTALQTNWAFLLKLNPHKCTFMQPSKSLYVKSPYH